MGLLRIVFQSATENSLRLDSPPKEFRQFKFRRRALFPVSGAKYKSLITIKHIQQSFIDNLIFSIVIQCESQIITNIYN